MKIKTKYMINFGLLVAIILLVFSMIIIIFYLIYRNQDFSLRLKNKAINTATLLFNIKGITYPILKIIDDKTVTNMSDVTVVILNKHRNVVYSNRDSVQVLKVLPTFRKLDWDKDDRLIEKRTLYLSFQRQYNNQKYYVLASAIDLYGQHELNRLLIIIIIAFLISIIFIILGSYFNARQSVRPIKSIINQVEKMNPDNLTDRLIISTKDEIAELSATFNNMLDRIEHAFENEKKFVSNVSHELRTPVTSIIGQLEVTLLKRRSEEDYKDIALSVLEDMKNMKTIINGFLTLAESSVDKTQNLVTKLRIDELIFSVKDEILHHSSNYNIIIEFENLPEDENDVMITGNDRLIRMLITNLIENSCKFSDPPKVIIKIAFNSHFLTLRFIDHGIGIPEDDLNHILEPMFRAKNVTRKAGHGIGLSIVKQISDLHNAKLDIVSELNSGTNISVTFPVAIEK